VGVGERAGRDVDSTVTALASVVAISVVVGIPWIVTIAATAMYARQVRTRAAYGMLWGAVGVLIEGVLGELVRIIIATGTLSSATGAGAAEAFGRQLEVASGVDIALGLAFGLLFAVSLLIVLRDAADTRSKIWTANRCLTGPSPSLCYLPNNGIERTHAR
jgi:hypothetical protein